MRRAMVTGASEGIGKAFARRLAADGWAVTLVARNSEKLDSLANELPGDGHCAAPADLTTDEGLTNARAALRAQEHHMLVNNAGLTHYGNFSHLSLAQHDELLNLNCRAPIILVHEFLRQASAGSAIINVSSMLAYMPQPTSAMYSASKAFVSSLSASLWYECKRLGVYVMALHPGITKNTEFRLRGGAKPSTALWAAEPEEVVDHAVRALNRREQATVICGSTNKLFATLTRLVPKSLLVSFLGRSRSKNLPGNNREAMPL